MLSFIKLVMFAMMLSSVLLLTTAAEEQRQEKQQESLREHLEKMIDPWQDIFALHDASAMVARYTEDCVYITSENSIAYGRDEAEEVYQKIFDSGVWRATLNLEDVGALGNGYIYAVERKEVFDKNDALVGTSMVLVIFREVDGGYQTYLKSDTPLKQ